MAATQNADASTGPRAANVVRKSLGGGFATDPFPLAPAATNATSAVAEGSVHSSFFRAKRAPCCCTRRVDARVDPSPWMPIEHCQRGAPTDAST